MVLKVLIENYLPKSDKKHTRFVPRSVRPNRPQATKKRHWEIFSRATDNAARWKDFLMAFVD
jgi:hypothetical protein